MKKLECEQIKEYELQLLISFSEYCDRHGLCYTLAGGTLLGAIRHKGFIPWDDDIDVMMPRSDYIRFQNIAKNQGEFEIRSISDGSCCIPYLKILNIDTIIHSEFADTPNANSLWIDVFPIDGLPKEKKHVKRIYMYVRFLRRLLLIAMSKIGKGSTRIRRIAKTLLYLPLNMIGSYRFARWIDNYCQKIKFEESNYVGGISWGYGPQECMPKAEWLERVKVEFEGHEFWAPGCWDLYLRNLYGDYMQLPPEEKRVAHNIVAYIKE